MAWVKLEVAQGIVSLQPNSDARYFKKFIDFRGILCYRLSSSNSYERGSSYVANRIFDQKAK